MDTERLTFRVIGTPIPFPRPRVNASGEGKPRVFNPKRYTEWKEEVERVGRKAMKAKKITEPLDDFITVQLDFYMPRPKTFDALIRHKYGGTRNIPRGNVPMPLGTDWDNLAKGVCDGLQPRIITDDRRIWRANVRQFYHGVASCPGVNVRILTMEV